MHRLDPATLEHLHQLAQITRLPPRMIATLAAAIGIAKARNGHRWPKRWPKKWPILALLGPRGR